MDRLTGPLSLGGLEGRNHTFTRLSLHNSLSILIGLMFGEAAMLRDVLLQGKRWRARLGYSLLELVVAGFIFATVSVALAGVYAYHYRAIGSSRMFLMAQFLARTRMENCIAAGYEKSILYDDGANPPSVHSVVFKIRDEKISTDFTLATQVTSAGAGAPRVCTVTVSWREKNMTRNVRYCANISPNA